MFVGYGDANRGVREGPGVGGEGGPSIKIHLSKSTHQNPIHQNPLVQNPLVPLSKVPISFGIIVPMSYHTEFRDCR